MKKKLTGMLSFLLLIALLVGCCASQAMAEEPAQDAQEEEEEENYETGDASLDNPRKRRSCWSYPSARASTTAAA